MKINIKVRLGRTEEVLEVIGSSVLGRAQYATCDLVVPLETKGLILF